MLEQKPIRAMALQIVTRKIMIDKAFLKVFLLCTLLIKSSYAAPASSSEETKNSSLLIPKILPERVNALNGHVTKEQSNSTSIDLQSDSERLKIDSTSDAKSSRIRPAETPMKSRKNKNDLFSFNKEFSRNKERERNTKPPVVLKRDKIPESEEPYFERKPALLLRFFPDGTAVLISKFQLHLHVKPKEIRFGADENLKMEDESYDYNPGVVLNDGKSFEVSYKRLEAIPTSKEQNLEEESGDKQSDDLYSDEDLSHKDHEFVTPSYTSTKSLDNTVRPIPLVETTLVPETTTIPVTPSNETVFPDVSNKSEESTNDHTNNESPFFVMTVGQMSSLQQQYDPVQALSLKSTSELQTERSEVSTSTEIPSTTTKLVQTTPLSRSAAQTTDSNSILLKTDPTATTTKCLSFQNQLSLVLSTEDNIDNSLLKKHILPTQDCNNTEFDGNNELAKIQSLETTTIEIPTTSTPPPTTTVPTITEKTTIPPQNGNLLVPYLASRMSVNPSKPDVVVVTSLPVLIDLKNRRNQAVTSVPSWREVTVGVVRDQQGQPLKPRYNNWTAHLRGLRKKSDNKFWNELTTPRNDIKPQLQPIQQAPSQINRAFWTDLQRDKQSIYNSPQRKNAMNTQPYVANPPKNYPTVSANQFVVWRNREGAGDRWNRNQMESTYNNAFYPPHDIMRMKGPQMSVQRNFDRQENKPYPPWNNGNMQHSGGRW